jgi:transposase
MILKKSECLRIVYEMKEEFLEIYETNMTVKRAQKKFKKWLTYADLFFPESAATIVNILQEFVTTFLIEQQVE